MRKLTHTIRKPRSGETEACGKLQSMRDSPKFLGTKKGSGGDGGGAWKVVGGACFPQDHRVMRRKFEEWIR